MIEIKGQMSLHELKRRLHEIVVWPKNPNLTRQVRDTEIEVDCWVKVKTDKESK